MRSTCEPLTIHLVSLYTQTHTSELSEQLLMICIGYTHTIHIRTTHLQLNCAVNRTCTNIILTRSTRDPHCIDCSARRNLQILHTPIGIYCTNYTHTHTHTHKQVKTEAGTKAQSTHLWTTLTQTGIENLISLSKTKNRI